MCQTAQEGLDYGLSERSWILLTCIFLTSDIHLCLQGNLQLQQLFLENKPKNNCQSFQVLQQLPSISKQFSVITLCKGPYVFYVITYLIFLCYYLLHKTLCSVQDLIKMVPHWEHTCLFRKNRLSKLLPEEKFRK